MSDAKPFQSVWADIGEVETELLIEALRSAQKLHERLIADRLAGKPSHPYVEHLAMDVECRLIALVGHSPHVEANFTAADPRDRHATSESHVVRPEVTREH